MNSANEMTHYIFKKPYITATGSTYYIGEKFPEHYLKEKLPQLFKDISIRDNYLLLANKVSLEDITVTPKVIGESNTKTLTTFELKEKEDITENIIYINEINFEDLIKIQGIGEKAATKLINSRTEKRFETIDELTKLVSTVKWDKYNIIY